MEFFSFSRIFSIEKCRAILENNHSHNFATVRILYDMDNLMKISEISLILKEFYNYDNGHFLE